MKSKCSFILKALTAMVLAVILLFSTVATGVAAIVEDIADTGYYWDNGNWDLKSDITWDGLRMTNNPSNDDQAYIDIYLFGSASNSNFNFKFKEENGAGNNSWFGPNSGSDTACGTSGTQGGEGKDGNYYINRKTLGTTSTTVYKVRIWFEHASWVGAWYAKSATYTSLAPTLTVPASGTVGTAITLTGGSTDANKVGTLTKTYQYSTDNSTWNNLASGSYTANEEGTVYFRYKVQDGGVVSGTNSTADRIEYSSVGSCEFTNPDECLPTITITDDTLYTKQSTSISVAHKVGFESDGGLITVTVTDSSSANVTSSLLSGSGPYTFNAAGNASAGTYTITAACSAGTSRSETITVTAPSGVYFKYSTDASNISGGGYTTSSPDKGQAEMTYDSDASAALGTADHVVLSATLNNWASGTHYWVIYDANDTNTYKNRYCSTQISNSNANRIGGTALSTTRWTSGSGSTGSIVTSNIGKGTTKVYYDIIDNKFYAELPIKVTYKGAYNSAEKAPSSTTTAVLAYGATPGSQSITVTGYSQTSSSSWYTNLACSTAFTSSSLKGNLTSITVYSPVTPKTSKLTFDANGGAGGTLPPTPDAAGYLTATYDSAMPEYASYVAPTKTGYTLDGWYYNSVKYYNADGTSARAWNRNSTVATTLTAKWTEVKAGAYVAAYTDGSESGTGGTVKLGSAAAAASGSIANNTFGIATSYDKITATASTGYHITGWMFDWKGSNNTSYQHLKWSTDNADYNTVANNTTLYNQPGNTTTTSQSIYLRTDGTSGITNANTQVKAMFAINQWTYTLTTASRSASSGNYAADASVPAAAIAGSTASGTKNYNTALTYTGTTSGGYKFTRFSTSLSTSSAPAANMPNNNYTVYACFEKGVNVTFKDYDDNTLKAATFTYDGNSPAAPASDPTRDGYVFVGWSSDGGTTKYASNALPALSNATVDIVYVAYYTKIDYSVTFSAKFDNGTGYEAGNTGGTLAVTNTDDTALADPTHMSNGDNIKLVAAPVAGYQFMGIYRIHSDTTEELVAVDPATLTCNPYTLNTDAEPAYVFEARFKKIYYLTFYNTTEDEAEDFKVITAPPRTVTIKRGGDVVATYVYAVGTLAQRGEDDQYANGGTKSEDHIKNGYTGAVNPASVTYYEGNKLTVLAGDTVIATYSALASSDTISGVFFNNGVRYTTELEPHNLYTGRTVYHSDGTGTDDSQAYTYLPATTLYANGDYYSTSASPYSNIIGKTYYATVDNDDHTVTWTAVDDYYNIDLELATKKQITFKNNTGVKVTSKNTDNFYDIHEDVANETGLKAEVDTAAQTSNNCTYVLGTPAYFTKDGKQIFSNSEVCDASELAADKKLLDTGFDIAYDDESGMFSGTMPGYDVVIDMNVTTKYTMHIASKMMSDPVDSRVAWSQVGRIAVDFSGAAADIASGGYTEYTAVVNATYDRNVIKGETVTYNQIWQDAAYTDNYLFLGWYKGDASGPYMTTGLLSTTFSGFTYTPKANTYIWAVGTRVMYIGGSFYINNDVQTYIADDDSKATWLEHLQMTWDAAAQCYSYTFDTVTLNQGYHFRVYETATNTAGEGGGAHATIFNRWRSPNNNKKYDNTFDGSTHTLNYGRYYTDGTDNGSSSWDNCGWFTINSTVQSGGYDAPVTVYFYPADGGIEVKATYQWKKMYVSSGANGYDHASGTKITNNTSNTSSAPNKTCVVSGQGGATVTAIGTSWNPTGSYTDELNVTGYYVKTKDGVVRVSKTVNTDVATVQAFVVYLYDSNKDVTLYSVEAVDDGSGTYHADITVSDNMYVYPVLKKAGANTRIYVNAADLDTAKWGRLVSLDAWNSSSTHVNGDFPGQLMIPTDNGKSWYADIVSTSLSGISFSNHYEGTWMQNQMTYNNVISVYNTIGGGNNKTVQTYDYREPVSLIDNFTNEAGEGDSLILSFTLKNGNIDLTSYNDSSDSNGAIKSSFYTAFYEKNINPADYTFEYLTDRTGKAYTDLTGETLTDAPTASFYVICKGNVYYDAGVNQSKTAITYASYDATYNGKWSVDWFVYDSAGNYITSILSDAYSHKTNIGTEETPNYLSVIAQKVKAAGYAYKDRAVAIAYDYPASYDSGAKYRFSGQWYTTTSSTPVQMNVEVAMKTGEDEDGPIIRPENASSAVYGTATATYTGSSSALASGTGYVQIKLSDAANDPVTVTATSDNFIGWYTYDEENETYNIYDGRESFTPSFNSDTTLYAVYEAKATYVFTYTSRDGSTKSYAVSASNLLGDELIDNIPRHGTIVDGGSTTRLAEAATLLPLSTQLAIFETTVTFSTANYTESKYTITFDCTASSTPNTYTLTYHYYDGSNATSATSASITRAYGKAISLSYDKYIKVANNGPSGKVFKGWYDASSGGNLISTYPSFGMAIVQNTEVWAQYDTTVGAYPDTKVPVIEKNVLSLERLSATAGTFYNDFIIRYNNSGNEIDPSKCGILIIYQNDTASVIGDLTPANLVTITTQLRAKPGQTANLTTKNAKAYNITCKSLSIFNRIDLVFKTSMATTGNRAYDAYAYFIDSSGNYHFTAATSANYNTFS